MLTCRSKPAQSLIPMKTCLTATAVQTLLLTMILVVLGVFVLIHMKETKPCECDKLVQDFNWMEGNTTTQITELQSQLQTLKEEMEAKYKALQLTQETLSQQERNLTRANDEAMQTTLAGIGRAYNGTVERVSAVERAQVEIEIGLRHTQEGLTRLDRDKVDRVEFEVLSANLTSLAEASSNEDDAIRQELSELADSSLNQTHYDTLHQTIQQLDSSKASQTDLVALATEVEVLSNSTVRTTTFHQQVESIESTTSQLQYNINQLRLNITSIDGRVRQITVTLATKADQASLNGLTDTVESLQTSKVDTQTFQGLEGTVHRLETSKADESDLSSLRGTVNSLRGTAAKESDLNDLEKNLRDHTSSSAQTHSVFTSDIRSNDGDIGSNTGRIEQLESSSFGLTASWAAVSMSVILVTVSLTIHTY